MKHALTPEALSDSQLLGEVHRLINNERRATTELIAALRPQDAVPSTVRKVPERKAPPPTPAITASAPLPEAPPASPPTTKALGPAVPRRAEVKPLAPEQYKVQFTVSRETHQILREAQDLLRHRIPSGDVGLIFERALTLLVEELRRTRHAAVDHPRPSRPARACTRHVPAAVKRKVWDRDQGRGAFVGLSGRCSERGFLEYHHVVPFADGGETSVENIQLRCRAHNAYEAERWFDLSGEDLRREARVEFC